MTSLFGASRTPTSAPSSPAGNLFPPLFTPPPLRPRPYPEVAARLESIKNSIRNELALQNAQELMSKVNDKCYAKCIPKPGASLSGSEEKCLSQCMDRYLEAFNIISKSYVLRLKKDKLDLQTPSL
ncbi:transporter [Ganoderma sinense ZZ0214-1]|uniref:Mitochondrial import inner membrane translocase subunit n=1 Tax=Ganoderma sinense ZZ0214-1 TaxID=1077348 RepID=A0A2G8SEP4_9APHY|nr:transporter [Ganoderma sinense ZZ0214-1]